MSRLKPAMFTLLGWICWPVNLLNKLIDRFIIRANKW